MTSPEREKIVDKLRKLRAMAESAGKVGNEAEAQAFAEMVQTLLAKHKLEASEVEWEQQQKEDIVRERVDIPGAGRRRIAPWEIMLAVSVGRASGCRIMCHKNNTKAIPIFWFAGAQTDAQAAREAFLYLHLAATHLAESHYVAYFHRCRKDGDVTRARGYKESWLSGFVLRLSERYDENLQAILSKAAGTAIIRVTGALDRVSKKLRQDGVKTFEAEQVRIKNHSGYRHGTEAANKIHLSTDPERRLS